MSVQATFSATLVDEWSRLGVADAVVCPGSRSTPLALALAAAEQLRIHVRLDERSAGFFALGLAMASGRPVVVCVTSGTAAAELLPSVVEASARGSTAHRVHGRSSTRAARHGCVPDDRTGRAVRLRGSMGGGPGGPGGGTGVHLEAPGRSCLLRSASRPNGTRTGSSQPGIPRTARGVTHAASRPTGTPGRQRRLRPGRACRGGHHHAGFPGSRRPGGNRRRRPGPAASRPRACPGAGRATRMARDGRSPLGEPGGRDRRRRGRDRRAPAHHCPRPWCCSVRHGSRGRWAPTSGRLPGRAHG